MKSFIVGALCCFTFHAEAKPLQVKGRKLTKAQQVQTIRQVAKIKKAKLARKMLQDPFPFEIETNGEGQACSWESLSAMDAYCRSSGKGGVFDCEEGPGGVHYTCSGG